MKLNKILSHIVGISTILSLQSCVDNDFKEINSDVIGDTSYKTNTEYFDITSENKIIKGIRTNGLSAYQLGEYSQKPFGKTIASVIAQVSLPNNNPTFGQKSQEEETNSSYNEEEKVVSVKLNIPFFSTIKEKRRVGEKIETSYTLDSIYGSKNASFDIKVNESKYYLRDIDKNLENRQIYFSNFQLKDELIGDELANIKGIKINNSEVIHYRFDDPLTTDKDESKEELKRSAPTLSIDLDNNFFQNKIINKEGSPELSNSDAFKLYFKGIIIKTSNFSEQMLMLLDFSKANIEIVYEYKNKKNDGKEYKEKNKISLPLSGIKINQFSYEDENISSQKDIFLQGGKRFAELIILKEEDIEKIKRENWIINDAVLSFKLNKNNLVKNIPQRIYIYNAETGNPLIDYNIDATTSDKSSADINSKFIHLRSYNNKSNSYEIHIPHHITRIIKKGEKNVKLGIVVAQNIDDITPIDYLKEDNSRGKIPITTATTPLSVVLYGSDNSINENNRLRLKITYTKPNN